MIQSQSQILSITFSHLLRLCSQESSFQTNHLEVFYQQKSTTFFVITTTNKEEICKIISSLNINKSCVANSIPTKILHLV